MAATSRKAVDVSYAPFASMMDRIGRERGWPPMTPQTFEAARSLRGANFVGTPEEVYHHPATPFVHRFLGEVNTFHGRHAGAETEEAIAYVRPHEIRIGREESPTRRIAARVALINAAGPVVRVELSTSEGKPVEAELSHDRQAELKLAAGDAVHIGFDRAKVYPPAASG